MTKIAAILLIFVTCGCQSLSPKDWAKITLPTNIAISYAANIAIHEGGHVLAAQAMGAKSIRVSWIPGRDDDGDWHLANTVAGFERPLEGHRAALFYSAGPCATGISHVVFGELNRSGYVDKYLQSTLQWIDLGSMISNYGQAIAGLARIKGTDFTKQDVWYAAGFIGLELIYDIVRISFADGGWKKYIDVLFGEDFYDNNK